jgi:hypothetical protein
MICPDSDLDCDNVGCRRGGCQGRRPKLPLFRAPAVSAAKSLALFEAAISETKTAAGMTARVDGDAHRRQLVVA